MKIMDYSLLIGIHDELRGREEAIEEAMEEAMEREETLPPSPPTSTSPRSPTPTSCKASSRKQSRILRSRSVESILTDAEKYADDKSSNTSDEEEVTMPPLYVIYV